MAKEYVEESRYSLITDMDEGDKFTTKSRVITRSDVERFATTTGYTLPLFLSDEAAKEAGWKGQLVPGFLTVSLTVGLLIQSGYISTVRASLGAKEIKFNAPVYLYDSIHVETVVASKKQTKKGDWICGYNWVVKNQRDENVAEGFNT